MALKSFAAVQLPADPANSLEAGTKQYVDTGDGLLIPKSLVDAKGDLLTATADNTPARLAAGTNGYLLTADSAQSTGLKWALPAALVALTDASTITVDASLGHPSIPTVFAVTLGGNRTMGAPSNATDGQRILFRIRQDGTGSRTITWTSGSGGYAFGTDLTAAPTLTTTASAVDYVGWVYDSTKVRWHLVAYQRGY